MKVSKSISLTLLASVAAVAALATCEGGDPDTPGSRSADQAASNGPAMLTRAACDALDDPLPCREAASEAEQEYARSAPRYSSREGCEATGADCREDPAQPGVFMPALAGFVLGGVLGRARPAPVWTGPAPGCGDPAAAGACRPGTVTGTATGGVSSGGTSYGGARTHYYGSSGYAGSFGGGAAEQRSFAGRYFGGGFGARSGGSVAGTGSVARGGFGGSAGAHAGGGA